jgi:hypothetical protein
MSAFGARRTDQTAALRGMAHTRGSIGQTGLERRLFNLAHNAPVTYGLFAVAMAMLLGWISSVLFRRAA